MIQTLYIHRPLLNTDDITEWATRQGFAKTLDPDDMHVTVAFSKKALPWHKLRPHTDELHVIGDKRAVVPLGEKGATVLQFFHPHLHHRWKEILSHGASWEHDGYRPHVSITYEPHDLDLQMIEPYQGPLVFGAEKFAPVVLDWDKKIKEVPLVTEKQGVLTLESSTAVKYSYSIKGNNNMATDSLSSLLVKNIDLILEAFNVDEQGNLVEVNKKKVKESDEIFHQYFVKSMNGMFRTLNEADPIMHEPNMIDPMGSHNGMHPMGHGMAHQGHHQGMGEPGADDMLGDMMMDDMDAGTGGPGMEGDPRMGGHQMGGHQMSMGDMHQMPRTAPMGGPGHDAQFESTDSDYDWVFNEDTDLDIDSLFNLSEEDEDEEGEEDDQLNEFGMGFGQDDDDQMGFHQDEDDQMGGGDQMGGSMDMQGGHNDFGGDMGGMGHDDMGGDEGMMGGDDDMVTVHGTTDGGGEFEFSFDPETLGFGGDMDDMGGDGEMGGGDSFGGHESREGGEHDGGGSHFGDESGMGEEEDENPVAEAKKPRRSKSSKMAVVPSNPASGHAAPFPTPQGTRQKRK